MYEEAYKRLNHFMSDRNIMQKDIADAVGVHFQYINAICNGRRGISKKMAQTLEDKFGVSAGWLLTGKGTMIIDYQDETIKAEEEPRPVISYDKGRPFFDVDFAAGFRDYENDQTTLPAYNIDFPPFNGCDCWCVAHGSSMSPTITSGDIIALKRVEDISVLINGDIYAIVTSNGLRTVKRIHDNGDTLTLIPDNTQIQPQTINKTNVTHAYKILGFLRHL